MRFYNIDGIEEDIQDLSKHIAKEVLLSLHEAIDELLSYYD